MPGFYIFSAFNVLKTHVKRSLNVPEKRRKSGPYSCVFFRNAKCDLNVPEMTVFGTEKEKGPGRFPGGPLGVLRQLDAVECAVNDSPGNRRGFLV